jgi:hypothetical protein
LFASGSGGKEKSIAISSFSGIRPNSMMYNVDG